MFDDQKGPQDIFAETDKAAPQVPPPTATVPMSISEPIAVSAPAASATPPAPTPAAPDIYARVHAGGGGGWKVVVMVVAILVVIGGAFLISWRILRSRTPVTPQAPDVVDTSSTEPESESEPEPEPEPEPTPALDKDTDLDGLSDLREAQLRTNSNLPDTDTDGLFDREEVDVYGTDPLMADTDGDGYQDGQEVKGGYDPSGPGKLLEVPGAS